MPAKSDQSGKAGKKSGTRRRPPKTEALRVDPHILYQESVQDAAAEIDFISSTFRQLRKRRPLSLKEDFCGTALVCAEWVKSHAQRIAVGLDLDPDVLAWGHRHNLAQADVDAKRVTLLKQNVLAPVRGKFDVCIALNFSYFIFKERPTLRRYFAAARRSLKPDGVFFCDVYGGWESQEPMMERRRQKGFTYVWDQAAYNPIDASVINHIHFHFPDGSKIRRAFTYEWRLWQLAEIRELLGEAGFSRVRVYWEEEDKEGEGTGFYYPCEVARNDPGWLAYVVAEH